MRSLRAALVLAGSLAGCADAPGPSTAPGPSDATARVGPCYDGTWLLAGEVSDEACVAFREAEARGLVVTDPTRAPRWTAPTGTVTKALAPRFAWTTGTLAEAPARRWWRALSPVSTAWAHGNLTGDAAVLIFRDAAGVELYRVLTSGSEFTPDIATWRRMVAYGPLEITLVGARFAANALVAGVRPTAGEPLKLTAL